MCKHSFYSETRGKTVTLSIRKPTNQGRYYVYWRSANGKLLKTTTGTSKLKDAKTFQITFNPDQYELEKAQKRIFKDTNISSIDATDDSKNIGGSPRPNTSIKVCYDRFFDYKEQIEKVSSKTLKHYRTAFNQLFEFDPSLAEKPVSYLCVHPVLNPRKSQEIKKLFDNFLASKSRPSAKKYRNAISSFYTYLMGQQITSFHLLQYKIGKIHYIVLYNVDPISLEWFTDKEMEKLLNSLDEDTSYSYMSHQYLRDIIIFCAKTGLRENEMIHLKWTDVSFIDEKKSFIRVRRDTETDWDTKNHKFREIPLNPEAYQILWKRFIDRKAEIDSSDDPAIDSKLSPYIFHTHVGENWRLLKEHAISQKGTKLCRAAFGPKTKKKFHSLRDTFGTNLGNAGVPIHHIKKLMGHKDIQTTMRYLHNKKEHLFDAVSHA